MTSSTSHIQLEYDERDRVVQEHNSGTAIRRQYQGESHTVIRSLHWEGEEDSAAFTSTFRYSATGGLRQVQLPDGAELTLAHDGAGRESSRQSQAGFMQHREYDAMGWLTREMSGQTVDGRLQPTQTREYLYDGAGNLTGTRRNREAAGYQLDASGRVLSVLSGGAGRTVNTEEQYRYTHSGLPQDAIRLTEWQAGRLTQQDNTHYQYDKAGRLIRKQVVQPGYRPQVWHYRWDSRNQLRVVDTPAGERWFYRYDPFGRRIGKRCDQTQDDIRYLWDGDQIAEVRHYRDGDLVSRRHWIHNGWELLVQQRQTVNGSWETDFVTSGHNGEPQAIFNPQGEIRWQAPRTNLWGQRYTDNTENLDPGLAFAGQYRDAESSLCYNRFRYYDPNGGCYISPDPIGALGGDNNYAYAPNPIVWIDPLGLAKCPTLTHGANGEIQSARATVSKAELRTGSGTNQSSRDYARSLGNQTDDAGHILGNVLGGQGGKGNVFPQLPGINRGRYRDFEKEVKDYIEKNGSVDIEWVFKYENGGSRPTRIFYDVYKDGQKVLGSVFNN